MTALPVEWVLVIYYGPSAHRATYGRLSGTLYTKDYIQLSKTKSFVDDLASLFPPNNVGVTSLVYKWPLGNAAGKLIFHSADRPHLAWETQVGAPTAWKMALTPNSSGAETIPGDPNYVNFTKAENELALLATRGAGQPYLMAIKLRGEPNTLHLRAYLANPDKNFDWANIRQVPQDIQVLVKNTSQQSALAWSMIESGGLLPSARVRDALAHLTVNRNYTVEIRALDSVTTLELFAYLENPAHGLFFDQMRNHDAWLQPTPLSEKIAASANELLEALRLRVPELLLSDAVAEKLEVSADEVDAFNEQIKAKNYEVGDTYTSVKTRGSAQTAFAQAVKGNYGFQCAITGIKTQDFLVAAHIVPWSQDQSIRLDPTNGICLSVLMDRAFENGYLLLEGNFTIVVNWGKVGDDVALRMQLEEVDGQKLKMPSRAPPKPEYLQRRRTLVNSTG